MIEKRMRELPQRPGPPKFEQQMREMEEMEKRPLPPPKFEETMRDLPKFEAKPSPPRPPMPMMKQKLP